MDNPMDHSLDTAKKSENLKIFVIEPLSRMGGHGEVPLLVDDNNQVQQCR
jgi:NAD-reducing hydrogenase large subunit